MIRTLVRGHIGSYEDAAVAKAAYERHNAEVAQVVPASGRPYRVTQSHWLRIADGMVIEHWANRDDMAMAMQLGWFADTQGRTADPRPAT